MPITKKDPLTFPGTRNTQGSTLKIYGANSLGGLLILLPSITFFDENHQK